jgi:predicted transcriptional regulator
MEKRDAAKVLYMEGYAQTDIARILGISNNTVSAWVTDSNWKGQRVSRQLLEDNSVQRVLELIDYQTQRLIMVKNNWINEDPNTVKLIEKGDIDALLKLFTAIKRESTKFSAYASVLKELLEYLQLIDLELAKQLAIHGDAFLQHKQLTM